MERDADTGKRAFRSADADADEFILTTGFSGRGLCARAPRYLEFNGLLVSNSLLHDIRPRQGEWPDIRLVRGIRPVALIFHLEHVPTEAATRGYAGSDLVTNGLNIFERLRRRNKVWEHCCFL